MSKHLAVIVLGLVIAVTGCKSNDKASSDAKLMSDACPMCPGVQAKCCGHCKDGAKTADGNCAMCAAMNADACSHCDGVQTLTTEGKCSSCGMSMKK